MAKEVIDGDVFGYNIQIRKHLNRRVIKYLKSAILQVQNVFIYKENVKLNAPNVVISNYHVIMKMKVI